MNFKLSGAARWFAIPLVSLPVCSAVKADEWLVLVSPYVWGASMRGNVSVGGMSGELDKSLPEILSHLDSVFMGNVEVTNRRFGFYIDGVHAQTSESHSVSSQNVEATITQTSVAFGAFYRVYEYALGSLNVFGDPRAVTVDPSFGARWTKLKAKVDVDSLGVSGSKSANWTDPLIGLRIAADLSDRWTLLGQADFSAWDTTSKKTFSAQAFLGYRTFFFDYPTTVRVGYRVLHQEYETGDFTGNRFKYDMTQRGPGIGFTMRF